MTLYLVRHARALDRSGWAGDDLERPLTERGRRQADALVDWFDTSSVRFVMSSQARRCIDTVQGLADATGVEIEVRAELTEGAPAVDLLELLRAQAVRAGDSVLCSHGDLIPEAVNRLLGEGLVIQGPRGCEKGSVWAIETRGRDLTRAVYTAAPGGRGL